MVRDYKIDDCSKLFSQNGGTNEREKTASLPKSPNNLQTINVKQAALTNSASNCKGKSIQLHEISNAQNYFHEPILNWIESLCFDCANACLSWNAEEHHCEQLKHAGLQLLLGRISFFAIGLWL